jgi:hypothetical protein
MCDFIHPCSGHGVWPLSPQLNVLGPSDEGGESFAGVAVSWFAATVTAFFPRLRLPLPLVLSVDWVAGGSAAALAGALGSSACVGSGGGSAVSDAAGSAAAAVALVAADSAPGLDAFEQPRAPPKTMNRKGSCR